MKKRYKMTDNKTDVWIFIIAVVGIPFTLYLVINELLLPGYCPPYPAIDIPACYLVLLFFLLVLFSRFVKAVRIRNILFFTSCIAGIVTAMWFSTNQIIGNLKCPVILGIPLCYASLLIFSAMLFLGLLKRNS